MSEVLNLLKLQEIDLELIRCKEALNAKQGLEELKDLNAQYKRMTALATKILGLRKDAEIEMSDLKTLKYDYLEKSAEVKARAQESASDYRSISSFDKQLSDLAKKIEKIDFTLPSKEKELEELKQKEALASARVKEAKTKLETLALSIKASQDELLLKINELNQLRAAAQEGISKEVYESYTSGSTRFSGLVVEKLKEDTPSVCRVKLQASQLDAIRAAKKDICECPYCHRLLVVKDVAE